MFLVVGLVFILLELVIPGGIAGTLGIIMWLVALYQYLGATIEAMYIVCGIGLVLIGISIIILKWMPGLLRGTWLSLQFQGSTDKGYQSIDVREDLRGKEGIAHTVLRPTGMAHIDGQVVEVTTEGDFYDPGTPIQVYDVRGSRVIVRKK